MSLNTTDKLLESIREDIRQEVLYELQSEKDDFDKKAAEVHAKAEIAEHNAEQQTIRAEAMREKLILVASQLEKLSAELMMELR